MDFNIPASRHCLPSRCLAMVYHNPLYSDGRLTRHNINRASCDHGMSRPQVVDLYIHSPIRLHGVVLNYLSRGTILPFTPLSILLRWNLVCSFSTRSQFCPSNMYCNICRMSSCRYVWKFSILATPKRYLMHFIFASPNLITNYGVPSIPPLLDQVFQGDTLLLCW
jgi:hypothetical protein